MDSSSVRELPGHTRQEPERRSHHQCLPHGGSEIGHNHGHKTSKDAGGYRLEKRIRRSQIGCHHTLSGPEEQPEAVSYTHLTLPTIERCRSRWSPSHSKKKPNQYDRINP